ncbi:MAG: GNAT family N-acetyltransferase [Pseudorhodoferax sp.]
MSDLTDLTYPSCRDLLVHGGPDVVAIEARAGDLAQPVGLALGRFDTGREVELLSLFVRAAHRGCGIGAQLVRAFEAAAHASGARRLRAVYQTGTGATSTFESILRGAQWEPPADRMLAVRCRLADLAAGTWLRAARRAHATCRGWTAVTPKVRQRLSAECQGDRNLCAIDPQLFEEGLLPDNSLLAVRRGRAVGWCITHAVGSVLRVTCAGTLPDRSSTAVACLMYDTLVRRAIASGFEELMWTVPLERERFAQAIERRLGGFATLLERVRVAYCLLPNSSHSTLKETVHGQIVQ